MSNSLQSRRLQHARLPCSSPTPGACSDSCPSSWWWQPTISSSVIPFSSCLQSCPASGFFFSNDSVLCISWSKYWCYSFNISPSNEYSGVISFRIDWFDLPEVQGTLRSLLQHHSSKTSIFWCSAFFIVQLSHPSMTTGKTTALTKWTFVDKVMSLLYNMLSKFAIAFLPRSKCLSNFMAAVTFCSDFLARENTVCHCFHCFPIYLPWSDGTRCHDLHFFDYGILYKYQNNCGRLTN